MTKEETRIEDVYRRWQSLSLFAERVAASPIEIFALLSLLTGFLSVTLLLILEISLISRKLLPDFSRVGLLSPYYILPSLLFAPAQGWYVHTLLSRRTPSDGSTPLWLKVVRCSLGSIPFLSSIVIISWMELLKQRPPEMRAALDLEQPSPAFSKKHLPKTITMLFLLATILNSILFYLWSLWVACTDRLGPDRRAVLALLCCVLHISLLLAFTLKPTTSERSVFGLSSFLYLLPIPFPIIAVFRQAPRTTILVGSITSSAGLLHLLKAKETLRAQWVQEPWFRQWRKPLGIVPGKLARGEVEIHLQSLYRQKTALLLLEGNILAQLLSSLGTRFPYLSSATHVTLLAATILGLALAGIGLGIMIFLAFRYFLRASYDRSPVAVLAFYLMLTQAVFVGGIQSRLLWNERRFYALIWLVIVGASLLFVLLTFLRLHPGGDRSARSICVLFLAFCQLASSHERIGLLSLEVLYLLALLTPLWSLILFLQLGAWLLRPFSLRDVFDGRFPLTQRMVLACVATTAALPLGALAIPFWTYSRSNLWPGFEANRLQVLSPGEDIRPTCLGVGSRRGPERRPAAGTPSRPGRPVASAPGLTGSD